MMDQNYDSDRQRRCPASSPILDGVGTLVSLGQRFPNMHYKISVERAGNGAKSARGLIDALPRRASFQIELEGATTLELQSGETIGIAFEEMTLRHSQSRFVATEPVPGA
ncbi:MAG: hypothetical protein ABSC92_04855 [Rhizomicrobium sp.]|jgi:hypothetical protein